MNPSHYPATFRVIAWAGAEGAPAHGSYAESYWLPILHPPAYVLGRRLVDLAVHDAEIEARWLAATVGILGKMTVDGQERTSLSTYGRAVRRLEKYHLLRPSDDVLQVRTVWPRLEKGLLAALPDDIAAYEPTMWDAERRIAFSVPGAWGR